MIDYGVHVPGINIVMQIITQETSCKLIRTGLMVLLNTNAQKQKLELKLQKLLLIFLIFDKFLVVVNFSNQVSKI